MSKDKIVFERLKSEGVDEKEAFMLTFATTMTKKYHDEFKRIENEGVIKNPFIIQEMAIRNVKGIKYEVKEETRSDGKLRNYLIEEDGTRVG